MFGLRMPEMLLILVVLLVVFGPSKLPQLGESLGKGLRSFRKASEKGLGEEQPAASEPSEQPRVEGPRALPERSAVQSVRAPERSA